jgi:nitrate reductase NapD
MMAASHVTGNLEAIGCEVSEYHICGVLLLTRPELAPDLALVVRALEGVEVHANAGGRLVVTIEGSSYAHCADMMNHLATLQGVASSSLVYHQVDNDTAQASQPEEIAP